MRQFTQPELRRCLAGARRAAKDLKKAVVDQEIFVATGAANSFVAFQHLTKAFQVHEAVLVLCKAGYGAEAFALSRVLLEMLITLRYITNKEQSKRAEEFALFVAKRKEYVAKTFAKYQPGNPTAVDALKFVETTYKQYADKYKSSIFWANDEHLKQLAAEKEELIQGLVPPNDDFVMYYEIFYSHASDYVHATAMALDEVFPPSGALYKAESAKESRNVFNAIIYATQWLFYIVIRVDAYRQLGLDEKIKAAHSRFSKTYHVLER